jgi:hypothetical protein
MDMEFKSAAIARVRYSQIRNKLGFNSPDAQASNATSMASEDGGSTEKIEGDAEEPTTPLKTPRKPRAPRKPRTPKGDGLTSPSPSKKRKSTGAETENVAPEIKVEEGADEDGGESVSVPIPLCPLFLSSLTVVSPSPFLSRTPFLSLT